MTKSINPVTFISYSRRQLYFAESLSLHLQKENHNIWFDLQQLICWIDLVGSVSLIIRR